MTKKQKTEAGIEMATKSFMVKPEFAKLLSRHLCNGALGNPPIVIAKLIESMAQVYQLGLQDKRLDGSPRDGGAAPTSCFYTA